MKNEHHKKAENKLYRGKSYYTTHPSSLTNILGGMSHAGCFVSNEPDVQRVQRERTEG